MKKDHIYIDNWSVTTPSIQYITIRDLVMSTLQSRLLYKVVSQSKIFMYILPCYIKIPRLYSLLRLWVYQPATPWLPFVNRQRCGQHVESPSHFWFLRPQISSYPNHSRFWVGTDLPCLGSTLVPLCAKQWLCLCVTASDSY